jgi:hypothetical protein
MTSSRQGLEADGLASKIWMVLDGPGLGELLEVLEGSRWAWQYGHEVCGAQSIYAIG